MRHLLLAATALAPLAAHAATYTVVAPGTTPAVGQFASLYDLGNQNYRAPFLKSGDIIQLPAGPLAPGDCDGDHGIRDVGTPTNPLTIQSPPGQYTMMMSAGCDGKAALDFYSSSVVVNGIIMLNSHTGANNMAGIRMGVDYWTLDANGKPSPYNLIVKNSAFFFDSMGILADDCSSTNPLSGQYKTNPAANNNTNGTCSVTIDGDTFSADGDGSGLDHAIYIDVVDQLTVTNSLIMDPFGGHLIKSRGQSVDIENNRLIQGPWGTRTDPNTLINLPYGGNATIKNNFLELGRAANGVGIIDYEVECYASEPLASYPSGNVTITGNTVVDDWSAFQNNSPAYYTARFFHDGSLDTGQGGCTHTTASNGVPANLTLTGNHFFGPYWTGVEPTDAWDQFVAIDGKPPYVVDRSNTFDQTSPHPAMDRTPTVPWPPANTTMETLIVTANGYEYNAVDGTHNSLTTDPTAAYPQFVLWFNGLPLTPAPNVVTADMSLTPALKQTFTFQVPVIPGMENFLQYQFLNPGCCVTGTQLGRQINMISATLNGVAPLAGVPLSGAGGDQAVTFAAQATQPPPVDTTPPVLATPATLTLQAGTSAPIALSATDPDNTAAQLTYKITSGPARGTIKNNGVVATGFTQAAVASGLVTYTSTGTVAATDSIGFTVSDPAGNRVSGTLPITVTAPPPVEPPPFKLAPGVKLIPHADGSWNWK